MLPNVIYNIINYQDETSIEESALVASKDKPIDMVIIATGILHEGKLMPEKSLKDLSAEKLQRLFEVNTSVSMFSIPSSGSERPTLLRGPKAN